ncbi:MAG: hypothetical protein KAQ92_05545 [Candidatus Aenigmarchaeota archaeon]|nr:hypothetical protein [Candidatus Aenigmarchaeota archaeon]
METENKSYIISEVLRISPLRVGALIGKQGSFKRKLEEKLDAKLVIDGKEGTVMCFLNDYQAYQKLTDIIRAISRGFSSETASILLRSDFIFHSIKLGKNKKRNLIQKARIIGQEGKIKKKMELISSTKISIYGKTISILGIAGDVELCNNAVVDILAGAKQNVVLNVMERKKKEQVDEEPMN